MISTRLYFEFLTLQTNSSALSSSPARIVKVQLHFFFSY